MSVAGWHRGCPAKSEPYALGTYAVRREEDGSMTCDACGATGLVTTTVAQCTYCGRWYSHATAKDHTVCQMIEDKKAAE